MGLGKTYSTKYLLDSNNSSGADGQVLISTSTGIDWSDANTIGNGLYLPLAGGTMTGGVTMGDSNGYYSHELKFSNDTHQAGIDFQNSGELRFIDRSGSRESITFNLLNGSIEAKSTGNTVTNFINTSGNSYFNGGNVGIGTTSPNRPLTIRTNNSSYGSMRIYRDSNTLGEASIGFFGTATQAPSESWVIGEGGWSNSGDFVIGNENGGAGGNVRLLVQRNGNVGIGTTSPGYTLDVNGTLHSSNITLADGIYHEGDTNTYINFLSDTIQLATGGSVRAYINSSGNVGIGTTSPSAKLDVNGIISLGGAKFAEYVSTSDLFTIGDIDGAGAELALHTDSGEAVRIDLLGNVGIGTTNPGAKLDVQGTSFFFDQAVFDDKVGIGTTNPGQKLTVSGTALIQNSSTPFYIKVNSTYKSWVHHIASDDSYIIAPSTADGGETWDWSNQTAFSTSGVVTANNFVLSSDKRNKTKIEDLAGDTVNISWKSFEMKGNEGEYRTGVIAQELEENHPEFVNTDDKGFKSVKYIDLLIAKIAELEARLEKAGI